MPAQTTRSNFKLDQTVTIRVWTPPSEGYVPKRLTPEDYRPESVQADVLEDLLAVHRPFEGTGRGVWHVSHLPTGAMIGRARSKRKAREIARAIATCPAAEELRTLTNVRDLSQDATTELRKLAERF